MSAPECEIEHIMNAGLGFLPDGSPVLYVRVSNPRRDQLNLWFKFTVMGTDDKRGLLLVFLRRPELDISTYNALVDLIRGGDAMTYFFDDPVTIEWLRRVAERGAIMVYAEFGQESLLVTPHYYEFVLMPGGIAGSVTVDEPETFLKMAELLEE